MAKAARNAEIASTLGNFRALSHTAVQGFAPDTVAKINAMINFDPKTTEPNTVFAAVTLELMQLGLCYEATPHPDEVLVHPDNRGNKMVSRESRENKARSIATVGVKEPIGGCMIELCPIIGDSLHEFCIRSNAEMVERGGGYLAPLTGKERYLSVATSNCYQTARSINAGSRTDVVKLQDNEGNFSKSRLAASNPRWGTFCEGWNCLVFKWICEPLFPKLAFLAQLARNTDNVVGVASGDLETMLTMLRAASSGTPWAISMEAAKSTWDGKTPLAALSQMATFFGPERIHLLERLQSFRSALSCEITWGGQFLMAVGSNPPGASLAFPMVRLACVACQLISPKRTTDGHGAGISVADFKTILGPELATHTDKVEKDATTLIAWLEALEKAKSISGVAGNNILFKFLTRSIMFLLKRQEHCYEVRVFASLREIMGATSLEMAHAMKTGKKSPCTWALGHDHAAPLERGATSGGAADGGAATQVGDATVQASATLLLQARGIKVGDKVVDKRVGAGSLRAFYSVRGVSDASRKVTIRRLDLAPLQAQFEGAVDLHELLKFFVKASAVPEIVSAEVAESKRARMNSTVNVEAEQTVYAWRALLEFADQNEEEGRFTIVSSKWGTRVFAARDFNVGELVVAPRCDVSELRRIAASKITSDSKDHDYITWTNDGDWADMFFGFPKSSTRLEPFNIVRCVGEGLPNLTVCRKTVGALTLPIFTNHRQISAHTELTLLKPQSDKVESFDQRTLRDNAASVRKKAEKDEASGTGRRSSVVGGDGASAASGVLRAAAVTPSLSLPAPPKAPTPSPPAPPQTALPATEAVVPKAKGGNPQRKRLAVKVDGGAVGGKKPRT